MESGTSALQQGRSRAQTISLASRVDARLGGAALVVAVLGSLAACSENPVGGKCFLGAADAGSETQAVVSSPALECQSRTCLQFPLGTGVILPEDSEFSSLCTAECEADDDCDRVPESPCQTGFTCMVPVVVGPFCCRKLCVCRDYLIIPDGGVPLPKACDPNEASNTCINLPGR